MRRIDVSRLCRLALLAAGIVLTACNKNGAEDAAVAVPNPVDKTAAAKLGFVLPDAVRSIALARFAGGNGEALGLEDFRGKVALLNVWATWCGPCRKEMPTLDRLQAKLGGPEFAVLALSVDQAGIDVVKDFFKETGIKHLRLYIDPSVQPLVTLNLLGLPATLLLDREGRELARLTGAKEWDSAEMVQFLQNVIVQTRTSP